ncbi:MAG TPA: hypothetical protein VIW71_12220 [Streptomyces sp.]
MKRWAPEMTHREKLAAMVLADDANDDTGLTYSSVVDPEIMRQAMIKTDREMRRVISRLQELKVIEHVEGGHNGKTAKYRFLTLTQLSIDNVAGPETPSYEEGSNDVAGRISPPYDGVAGRETPPYDDSNEQAPGEKSPATGGVGGLFPPSRRAKKALPTPSPPTTTSSSSPSVADAPAKPQRKPRTRPAAGGEEAAAPRADVEAVCTHLADVLEHTGSKRPTITGRWRTAARLLLDRDGITVEQAQRAIDWAHADDFWQAHILTPMKLREKYETLRRKATAEQRKTHGRQRGGSVRDPIPDWNDNTVEIKL